MVEILIAFIVGLLVGAAGPGMFDKKGHRPVRPAKPEPPEVGKEYVLSNNSGDPFPRMECRVQVLEVREGWVRYRHTPTREMFQNERTRVSTFVAIYKPA